MPMPKFPVAVAVALVLVVLFLGVVQVTRGQATPGEQVISREEQAGNVREVTAPAGEVMPAQTNIGFIDSPSATCYQPDITQDACYLNWYYMSVDASPNYMITMTVSLNPNPIAHTQGFFQTSMYVPYNMYGDGFKVACGALGEGGNPALGKSYAYTVRARDSANLSSANYGTVYCPAYVP